MLWMLLVAIVSGCATTTGVPLKNAISTPAAPTARGPYSQAVSYGNLLFVSGQLAFDPAHNKLLAHLDTEGQTLQVLDNIKAVLAANGMGMEHVLSATVYLADVEDFKKMNPAYESCFLAPFPARATVGGAMVVPGARVEIAVIAGR